MKPVLLILPALLLGCTANVSVPGGAAADPATTPAPAETPVQAVLDGETRIAVGQVLEVALEGSAGTGYAWQIVDDGAPWVTPQSARSPEAVAADPGAPQVVGGAQVQRWRFRAAQPGEATLRFVQRRPWEQDVAPAREATYRVEVYEAGAAAR